MRASRRCTHASSSCDSFTGPRRAPWPCRVNRSHTPPETSLHPECRGFHDDYISLRCCLMIALCAYQRSMLMHTVVSHSTRSPCPALAVPPACACPMPSLMCITQEGAPGAQSAERDTRSTDARERICHGTICHPGHRRRSSGDLRRVMAAADPPCEQPHDWRTLEPITAARPPCGVRQRTTQLAGSLPGRSRTKYAQTSACASRRTGPFSLCVSRGIPFERGNPSLAGREPRR